MTKWKAEIVSISVLSRAIVMSINLWAPEYRESERQRKRESRRQAGEAQREKGRQRSRARHRKGDVFFVGSSGDKMRAANNQIQGENERR